MNVLTMRFPGKSIFKIDASSGTVTLSTELDYEENRVIRIPVLAQSETFDKAVTEVIKLKKYYRNSVSLPIQNAAFYTRILAPQIPYLPEYRATSLSPVFD